MNRSQPPKFGLFDLSDSDRGALAKHFLDLDAASRSSRFGVALSDSALQRIARDYPMEGATQGLFYWGRLVAVCTLVPLVPDGSQREFALSLDKDFRGAGRGQWLADEALQMASYAAVDFVHIHYSFTNQAMARIVARYPGELQRSGADARKVVDIAAWTLANPTHLSLAA